MLGLDLLYLSIVRIATSIAILFLLSTNFYCAAQTSDWKKHTISKHYKDSINYYGKLLPLANSITRSEFEQTNEMTINIKTIGCFGQDIASYSLLKKGDNRAFINQDGKSRILKKKESKVFTDSLYSIIVSGLKKYRTRKGQESFRVQISNYKTYVYFKLDDQIIKLNQYDLEFNELVSFLNDKSKAE